MSAMPAAAHAPLVEVTRGDEVESIHCGSVAVVDLDGRLLFSAGDPHCTTFTRSTIKPFQAAPFIAAGGARHFALAGPQVALLCASHSGQEMHVREVRTILARVGQREPQLACGCHLPLQFSLESLPQPGARFSEVHHNCSGKHAGFLAYCVQHGLPTENYVDPGHPLQRAVRQSVAHFAGLAPHDLKAGTDGCSAPNYAMPLSALALSYARLAQGAPDAEYGDALAVLRDAMVSHPELVSGTGRSDLAFMQAAPGDWIAKIGAEGVQVIGVRSAGIGIAFKVADGNARALIPAAIAVLQQLGMGDRIAGSALAALARPTLHNYAGARTGEVRANVQLLAQH